MDLKVMTFYHKRKIERLFWRWWGYSRNSSIYEFVIIMVLHVYNIGSQFHPLSLKWGILNSFSLKLSNSIMFWPVFVTIFALGFKWKFHIILLSRMRQKFISNFGWGTKKTRSNFGRVTSRNCLWDRYRGCVVKLATILSPVTVPQATVRSDSPQITSHF